MGYTHYWTIKEELTPAQFKEWTEGVKVIVETAIEAGIQLGNGLGFDAPNIEETLVAFNGVGEGGHETFGIRLGDEGFDFCKTAEKSYDAVVTASLIHAKKIFGDAIEIKSDGDWDDWATGKVLYETVFDIQPESVIA
jgi:NOL1/NOP2/fmu family ribosome biogenesis protein